MTDRELAEKLRASGFTAHAVSFPRGDMAIHLLAAFNGVPVESIPKGWKYFPNEFAKKAWDRVEVAATNFLAAKAAPGEDEVSNTIKEIDSWNDILKSYELPPDYLVAVERLKQEVNKSLASLQAQIATARDDAFREAEQLCENAFQHHMQFYSNGGSGTSLAWANQAESLKNQIRSLITTPAPEREPGTGWKISEETELAIKEIDDNRRYAASQAGSIIVGAPAPELEDNKTISEFVNRQQRLGPEFEKAIFDNIEELYESDGTTAPEKK